MPNTICFNFNGTCTTEWKNVVCKNIKMYVYGRKKSLRISFTFNT